MFLSLCLNSSKIISIAILNMDFEILLAEMHDISRKVAFSGMGDKVNTIEISFPM